MWSSGENATYALVVNHGKHGNLRGVSSQLRLMTPEGNFQVLVSCLLSSPQSIELLLMQWFKMDRR